MEDSKPAAVPKRSKMSKKEDPLDPCLADFKFEMKKGEKFEKEMITDDIKKYVGKKITIRGYIRPSFQQKNLKQFILVRDNMECCFGPGAALFDCVMVRMTKGNSAEFQTRPVTVEGKFKIDTKTYMYPGGKGPRGATHLAIFQIDGVNVK